MPKVLLRFASVCCIKYLSYVCTLIKSRDSPDDEAQAIDEAQSLYQRYECWF